MKRLLPLLFLFAGCSHGRNEMMTKLLIQKRMLEDSIESSAQSETMFNAKAREVAHATHDSTKYVPLLDSSARYYGIAHRLNTQLLSVQFSIDSLGKMK